MRCCKSYLLLIVFIGISLPTLLICQSSSQDEDVLQGDAQREEIQRYIGYEDVLFRYLTLPYDVSVAVNQRGRMVDLGYLFLAGFPLFMLAFSYRRKKLFYILMAGFVIYLCMCFQFGHILAEDLQQYNPAINTGLDKPVKARLDGYLLEPIYRASDIIGQPIAQMLQLVTGKKDHTTYLTLAGIWLIISWLIMRSRLSLAGKILCQIGWCIAVFWWISSAGIIWYALLLVPLSYVLITKGLNMKKLLPPLVRGAFFLATFTWVCMAFVARVSNNNEVNTFNKVDVSKNIIDFRLMPYTIGQVNAHESLAFLGKNIDQLVSEINKTDGIVIQVSTPVALDINRSDLRLFEDNTLAYFLNIAKQQRTKGAITKYYYDRGVEYFVLDIRLPSIDFTPEKSLLDKYKLFVGGFLMDNDRLQLIATDQRLKRPDGSVYYGFFPKNGEKMDGIGSYVAYKIVN